MERQSSDGVLTVVVLMVTTGVIVIVIVMMVTVRFLMILVMMVGMVMVGMVMVGMVMVVVVMKMDMMRLMSIMVIIGEDRCEDNSDKGGCDRESDEVSMSTTVIVLTVISGHHVTLCPQS